MHGEMHDITCPTNEGVILAKDLKTLQQHNQTKHDNIEGKHFLE